MCASTCIYIPTWLCMCMPIHIMLLKFNGSCGPICDAHYKLFCITMEIVSGGFMYTHTHTHTHTIPCQYTMCTYREQAAVSHGHVGLADPLVAAMFCHPEAILLTHLHPLGVPDVSLQPLILSLSSFVLQPHVTWLSPLFAARLLCLLLSISHTRLALVHLEKK